MKRLIPLLLTIIICGLALVVLARCDSGGMDSDGLIRTRVLLTDAPADSMLEANVTIRRVELKDSSDSVIVLSNEERTFDLLELQNGLTAVLADTLLPERPFRQIRIIVKEEARVVWESGLESTLKIPSGSQTGIKIIPFDMNRMEQEENDLTLTLDFHVEESFVIAGNSGKVLFKPVIRLVEEDEQEESGDVENAPDDEG